MEERRIIKKDSLNSGYGITKKVVIIVDKSVLMKQWSAKFNEPSNQLNKII